MISLAPDSEVNVDVLEGIAMRLSLRQDVDYRLLYRAIVWSVEQIKREMPR